MSAIAEVYQAVVDLPPRADDIARLLTVLGVKGRVGDPHGCPLVNYLRPFAHGERLALDSRALLEVGDSYFELWTDDPNGLNAAAVFMGLFDDGCYPWLIDALAIEARP